MEIIIYIIVFVVLSAILFRYRLEQTKTHELNLIPDSYGAIQVFDNEGLVAILYRDRTIDWQRSTSFFKMAKIKEISDRFEEELDKLNQEL